MKGPEAELRVDSVSVIKSIDVKEDDNPLEHVFNGEPHDEKSISFWLSRSAVWTVIVRWTSDPSPTTFRCRAPSAVPGDAVAPKFRDVFVAPHGSTSAPTATLSSDAKDPQPGECIPDSNVELPAAGVARRVLASRYHVAMSAGAHSKNSSLDLGKGDGSVAIDWDADEVLDAGAKSADGSDGLEADAVKEIDTTADASLPPQDDRLFRIALDLGFAQNPGAFNTHPGGAEAAALEFTSLPPATGWLYGAHLLVREVPGALAPGQGMGFVGGVQGGYAWPDALAGVEASGFIDYAAWSANNVVSGLRFGPRLREALIPHKVWGLAAWESLAFETYPSHEAYAPWFLAIEGGISIQWGN